MKKIILIEGVSGVGKSNTTMKLRDTLNEWGYRSLCYLEGDVNNPVDFYSCAYLSNAEFAQLLRDFPNDNNLLLYSIQERDYVLVRYGDQDTTYFQSPLLDILKAHEGFIKPLLPISIKQYTQVFEDSWRRYLGGIGGTADYAVFDGCFLYHRSNDLIMNYNATDETIAAHLSALLSAMAPYKPLLFYLSSDDVGKRLVQARESRGQASASEARVAFEIKRKCRQLNILELLPINLKLFNISWGWERALDDMVSIITEESL